MLHDIKRGGEVMTFSFGRLLFSVVLATLIYAIIWRIATFRFRIAVCKLVYLVAWVRIEREVKRIILTAENGEVKISSLDYKDEPVELEVDNDYILKILSNSELFDWHEINDNNHEFIPNKAFSLLAQNLEEKIIKKSKKLHERFDTYPLIIRLRLEGASKVLDIIDSQVSGNIAQNVD